MLRFGVTVALACVACAGNPGVPRFRNTTPPPVAPVGPRRPAASVKLETAALPWWTVTPTSSYFVLGFDDQPAPTRGTRVGPLRSQDVAIDEQLFAAVRCAWEIVPVGDPRACVGLTRQEAMTQSHDVIAQAREQLRAQGGELGTGVVGDIRCFAERDAGLPGAASGRLWCEGVALAAEAPTDEVDAAATLADEPRLRESRLVVVADGGFGMQGDKPFVTSTLGVRYRPFEIGFYMLDLKRESITPMEHGHVGLGVTGLFRHAIGGSRADALIGGSAIAAFQNGATNPDFDGLYQGFVGLAYQSTWRLWGTAQPFAQLRAGAATGTAVSWQTLPMVELHLGLTTPERR